MIGVFNYILYFFIYSFFGWICEVIYCSDFSKKEFVNRGMLKGPLCPIYGVGSCILIFCIYDFRENLILVFLLGVLITSLIEYFASFLLEKLFNARWWDYETYPLNINGRICILNSALFGIMTIFLIRYVHPEIEEFIGKLPIYVVCILVIIFLIRLFGDLFRTVKSLNNFNNDLCEIRDLNKELIKYNLSIKDIFSSKEFEFDKKKLDFVEKSKKLKSRYSENKRILKAFPRIKHKKFDDEVKNIRKIIKNKGDNRDNRDN